MNRITTHTILIKLNGIRSKLQDELEDLQNKRKTINDKFRKELETRIGIRKQMIKDLNTIDLDIRSEL
tara:strand:- start:820 stop:1023 length:204 start_codon:yes stop_codon:yes gene_type:complete